MPTSSASNGLVKVHLACVILSKVAIIYVLFDAGNLIAVLPFRDLLFLYLSSMRRPVHSIQTQSKQSIIAVYAADRSLPKLRDKSNHPSNVVILDSIALKRFYGPTLSGANGFLLRLSSATNK
jgi:hypothetical protein